MPPIMLGLALHNVARRILTSAHEGTDILRMDALPADWEGNAPGNDGDWKDTFRVASVLGMVDGLVHQRCMRARARCVPVLLCLRVP